MLSKSQVKYIQSLGQKKFRNEEAVFIAEGPRIVQELMQETPALLKQIYAQQDWIDEQQALLQHFNVTAVTDGDLSRISQLTTPNRVLAVVQKPDYGNSFNTKNTVTLALDDIRDPGNLGTIIRIADWFGISQVLCSKASADMFNPKVVQSTMGSIVRVKVLYTDLLPWIQQQPVSVYAAVLDGKDVTQMPKLSEGIIIIGNEAHGIDEKILAVTNERITIPRKGRAESLNAAVATGIILSHLT
jgi:TrmH family RNA methyltransferase